MATVTRILETADIAQLSLVGKVGDFLVANQLRNGNKVVKIGQDSIEPFNVPVRQTFTAGTVTKDNVVCSVLQPAKPQFGVLLSMDGAVVKLDPVNVKKAAVIPFWSDGVEIYATVADGTVTKRTGVYDASGKLKQVVDAQLVGKHNDVPVKFEASIDCPDGFSLPVASRASGNVTIGQMYLNDKRSGANACSWAKVGERDIWMVPNGALGCDRFVAKSYTSDGEWVFGLAYQSIAETPFQVNAAFNTVNGTWHSLVDLFGVDLSFADLVVDGDAVYGRASDGIYKVEGWKQ